MTQIHDYELMDKMMKVMKKSREGHGPCPDMPPRSGERCHEGPRYSMGRGPGMMHEGRHEGPHGPGQHPHGFGEGPAHRRPPLTREHLLVIINEYPEGVRQKTLAERARINPSSASELIDKLEGDGYVTREVDPNDKRATLLFLTEKGTARAAEVEDERSELFKDLFAPLTDKEKQTLSDLLDKILAENSD